MIQNITQVLRAIRILDEALPARDAAGKLEAYLSAKGLLREIEANLHPTYHHHAYTRENIMRVEDAIAARSGFVQLGDLGDVNRDAVAGRLEASLIALSDSSRWPSTCTLINDAGVEGKGSNDPS